jgi:peptidase M15-like protein
MTRIRALAAPLVSLGLIAALPGPARQLAFDPQKLSFSVRFKDEVNPYSVLAAFVMPRESMRLEVLAAGRGRTFTAEATTGSILDLGSGAWSWRAPDDSGLCPIRIADARTGEAMTLNVFVLVPYDGARTFHGYRIGHYHPEPLRGEPAYQRPRGFVEVSARDLDTPVAPHFKLGQFLCKQGDTFPKYLILHERLLLKLEALLDLANERGLHASTFHVMSGFRTPDYNAAIGNSTTYSRHCYGDAADIFIDEDGDGRMDDLDGDGRVEERDGEVLERLVLELTQKEAGKDLVGGLHAYPATLSHGPMVHVDTRGSDARW